MARVKLSPLLSEVNGSIGQATFQRSLGGTMLRDKPLRKPAGTPLQLQNQVYMSEVIAAWQGLTDAQRLVWNQYSDYTPQSMKFNKDRFIKGYYLFIKYNMVRLQAGLAILSTANFLSPDPLSITPEIRTVDENFFVAVGAGTNTIAWSDDGISWTGLGTSIFSNTGFGIAFNGALYSAVGQGTNSIAWSNDGKIWTGLGTSIFSTNGLGVCWSGSIFVAVGGGTNSIAWSNDGKIWTGLGLGVFSSFGRGVAFNSSRFVAVGAGTNTIAWSDDGVNWNGLGTSIFSSQGSHVAWLSDKFVAVGVGGNTIAYSYDGINWIGLGASVFSATGSSVVYNGRIVVAGGSGTNTLAYSTDGINWIGLGTSIFSTNGFGLCWNGFRFVATGNGTNTLAYSSNGIDWTGIGTSIFSTSGRFCASRSIPNLFPVILHPIIFDYNINLDTNDQWALLKLSNSRPISENFKANKTRVIVIPVASGESFNVQDQLYALFGTNPFSDDILNVQITLFSQDASRLYPVQNHRLTISAS